MGRNIKVIWLVSLKSKNLNYCLKKPYIVHSYRAHTVSKYLCVGWEPSLWSGFCNSVYIKKNRSVFCCIDKVPFFPMEDNPCCP